MLIAMLMAMEGNNDDTQNTEYNRMGKG